jgi:eukaryotic-like serine/threonine-protein kinase
MEEFHSYKINPIERLGQGSFGCVEKIELYNSNDEICGTYARKILAPNDDILSSISMSEIKRRFIREVIYQSKCSHANIIQIFLFNQYVENPYFIMEIGESDLETELRQGVLNEDEKIKIMIMMLHATKKIHDKEYLHRDIKPQNILKFPDGEYKLSDFGLVKNVDTNSDTTALTAIGVGMGTKKYMAPEILIEGEYSKQTDIYALGILFSDLAITNKNLHPIIDKCKKRDKDLRYASVDDVLADIKQLLSTTIASKE